MGHHLSLVFTNAASRRDEDFNRWYDDLHAPEVLANIPGFVSVQRYRLHDSQRLGVDADRHSPWRYLAVYELETDDVAASHRATEDFKAADGFSTHDGALAGGHAAWVYDPLGPRLTEPDVAADAKADLGSGQHIFLAFTNPTAGREGDFERWYETHVREVVRDFPGLTTGRRYRAGPDQRVGMTPGWDYLALYDMQVADMDAYHRHDGELRASGTLTPHDGALDAGYAVWVYSQLGRRITADQAGAMGASTHRA